MSWAPGWYGWDPDSEDAAAWGPFTDSGQAKGHPDPFAPDDAEVRVFYVSVSDTPRHRTWSNETRQAAIWVDGPDSEAARAARGVASQRCAAAERDYVESRLRSKVERLRGELAEARAACEKRAELVERAARNAGWGEKRRVPRWSAVGYAFGLGSTSATALCRELGLDPDEEVGNPCEGGCDD